MSQRLKKYFKTNPGVVFIIAFEVLLVVAALLLLQGNWNSANQVGVGAFFALVVAIVVQIAYPVWAQRKHAKADR